jgi:hypothetical protein
VTSPTGEWCRRCLDLGGGPLALEPKLVPADGIVWGKLNPPEALGPRCLDCIEEQCGYYAAASVRSQDHTYAIFPLGQDRSAARHASPSSESTCP